MRRRAKKTALVCCEGDDDARFVKCVKEIYSSSSMVEVFDVGGGSMQCVVNYKKIRNYIAYRKKFALIDLDRGQEELAKTKEFMRKKGLKIDLIIAENNLECELMKILETDGAFEISRSKMQRAMRGEMNVKDEIIRICGRKKDFKRIFTRDLLDTARHKSEWLNKIIKIFEE